MPGEMKVRGNNVKGYLLAYSNDGKNKKRMTIQIRTLEKSKQMRNPEKPFKKDGI